MRQQAEEQVGVVKHPVRWRIARLKDERDASAAKAP